VLHLSALACVHNGAVYLLPGNARPDDPDTWIALSTVLDAFGACPAKHKLLLLDVARPLANPFRGPLVDDVAECLHGMLTRARREYFVLCSCSPGEFALPREDVEASAFADAVVQGLSSSAADRYNPARASDDRVSVRELAAFVTARVSRWAEQTRGVRQTPVLYGDAKDFPLTFGARALTGPAAASADYPAALLSGWKRHDDWRAAGAPRLAPAAFEQLEATLLRAERAWEAGLAARVEPRLATDLAAFRGPLDAATRPESLPLRSLAAARAGRPDPPAELGQALDKYLAIRFAGSPPKPEELQKAQEEFTAKAKALPLDAAGLIWDRLVADPKTSNARFVELTALLDRVLPQPLQYEEQLLLHRLAVWNPLAINWPVAEVNALLRAEDAAGRALRLLPDGFPWVRAAIEQADTWKGEGEDRLLRAKTDAEARAAAQQLADAESGFTAARRQLEVLQAARRAVADSAVVLIGTVPGVVAGEIDEYPWRTAADAATALADVLTRGRPGGALPPNFGDRVTALESSLAKLQGRYAPDAVKKPVAATAKAGGPDEYKALQALLRSPLLKAPERKAVWEAARKLARRLQGEVAELNQADDDANRSTPAPPSAAPDGAGAERAARRVRVSAALLRLVGLDGADRVGRAAAGAPVYTPALAAELRDAWTKRLPEQFRRLTAQGDWPAAGRLSRGPAVPGAYLSAEGDAPPVRLRRQEEQECRRWLEGHYREYGRLRASVPGAPDFYDEAAADSRR
jgi:hypothetical protein